MKTSYEELLKNHNLSLTAVRMAVLEALDKRPHSDVVYIFEAVQSKITTTSKQAIYNNLNTLLENGIIREIKPKGQLSLYETRVGDNHHHLVCRYCQQIIDVECQSSAPCLSSSDSHGFIIDEAEITFWGICSECQRQPHPPSPLNNPI